MSHLSVCENYSLKDMDINKNFFFVNSHGGELNSTYEIPHGIRIIMFCHTTTLNVCPKFDKFNWENILLDPDASKNYCSFLYSISKHASIRDHFCIYEEGEIIRDISLYSDETFRGGLYRLPVKGYAYDEKEDRIIVSEGTLLSEVHKNKELNRLMKSNRKRVTVDSKKIINLLRKDNKIGIIKSELMKINGRQRLSHIINSLKSSCPTFTILLMVCRDPDENLDEDSNFSAGIPVINALKRMENHIKLEKMLDGD